MSYLSPAADQLQFHALAQQQHVVVSGQVWYWHSHQHLRNKQINTGFTTSVIAQQNPMFLPVQEATKKFMGKVAAMKLHKILISFFRLDQNELHHRKQWREDSHRPTPL